MEIAWRHRKVKASFAPLWSTYQKGEPWLWPTAPATDQESPTDIPAVGAVGLCRNCSRASSVCYKIDFTEFSNQAGESCRSRAGDSRRDGEGDDPPEPVSLLLVPAVESAGSGVVSTGTKVQEPHLDIFWRLQNKCQTQCSPKPT